MDKVLKRSKLIADRLIECSNKQEIYLCDEVAIFNHLVTKCNLKTVPNAAKMVGISRQAMNKRVEKGKVMSVIIDGVTFISV